MKTSNLIKYQSRNPAQQFLIKRQFRAIIQLLKTKKINKVADIGCGEGFVLNQLALNHIGTEYIGLDNSREALKAAKKIHSNFKYMKGNIYKLPFKAGKFDLVICGEVLEHLVDPEAALRELNRISRKYVLISVPLEPWFQLMNFIRGKYIYTFGNHPEHINWWGIHSLERLVNKRLKILSHTISLPWQTVLCTVNKKGA